MLTWPKKDPDEVLDYQLDWGDAVDPRLEVGETLSGSVYTVTAGTVVIASQTYAPSGLTTVWLTGGTAGEKCEILNRVTTTAGRTYDQSVILRIRSK